MKRRVGTVMIAAAIVGLTGTVAWKGGALGYSGTEAGVRTFNVTGIGELGRWTLEPVNGLNYWWKDFTPATLYVETGEEVVLRLRSADVFHRFYMPEFSVGPVDVEAGHTATVRFKATHKGVFQFYCLAICGGCHFNMRGWIVVSDPGTRPIVPPPIVHCMCPPRAAAPRRLPAGADLVEAGGQLYQEKGCLTCHGLKGSGGTPNDNSTSGSVPAHNTTAQKFFLRSAEDADAFIQLVRASDDLASVEESDVTAFPVVRARFLNAKEIIRKGRFTSPANPLRPMPPLQMPAWKFLLDEREIDALLVYFVSLYDWDAELSE